MHVFSMRFGGLSKYFFFSVGLFLFYLKVTFPPFPREIICKDRSLATRIKTYSVTGQLIQL